MAVSYTLQNYSLLSDCDATSNGGTWSGGNAITTETDFYKYSSACIAYTVRQITTYQLDFSPTSSIDLSGTGSTIVRMWFMSFQTFATQANNGIRFYISDGTNTAYWNVLGGDTYPGGWYMIAVDVSTTQTSGTKPTMSAVTSIGIDCTTLATTKNAPSTYIDHLHLSDGITTYGDAGTSIPYDFSDIYGLDNTTSTAWGFIKPVNTIYFGSSGFTIGDSGANDTLFEANDSVLVFDGSPYGTSVFKLNGQQGTGSTDITLNRCVIKSSNVEFDFDFSSTIDNVDIIGCSIINASTSLFYPGQVVSGCTFVGNGEIKTNGASFTDSVITATTAATSTGALYLNSASELDNIENITFNEYTGKYAIYIPASVTGEIDFTGIKFDGSGTDIYWAGTSGTLTINLFNGANASTYSSGGGTVAFVSAKTLTLTGIIEGSEVRIIDTSDYSEISGVESLVGTTYSYNYNYVSDINIAIVVFNVQYEPVRIDSVLGSTDNTIPIQQIYDRTYKNPV